MHVSTQDVFSLIFHIVLHQVHWHLFCHLLYYLCAKNLKFGTCRLSARDDKLGVLLSGPPCTYIHICRGLCLTSPSPAGFTATIPAPFRAPDRPSYPEELDCPRCAWAVGVARYMSRSRLALRHASGHDTCRRCPGMYESTCRQISLH